MAKKLAKWAKLAGIDLAKVKGGRISTAVALRKIQAAQARLQRDLDVLNAAEEDINVGSYLSGKDGQL